MNIQAHFNKISSELSVEEVDSLINTSIEEVNEPLQPLTTSIAGEVITVAGEEDLKEKQKRGLALIGKYYHYKELLDNVASYSELNISESYKDADELNKLLSEGKNMFYDASDEELLSDSNKNKVKGFSTIPLSFIN